MYMKKICLIVSMAMALVGGAWCVAEGETASPEVMATDDIVAPPSLEGAMIRFHWKAVGGDDFYEWAYVKGGVCYIGTIFDGAKMPAAPKKLKPSALQVVYEDEKGNNWHKARLVYKPSGNRALFYIGEEPGADRTVYSAGDPGENPDMLIFTKVAGRTYYAVFKGVREYIGGRLVDVSEPNINVMIIK